MRQRCSNPNNDHYHRYGGRGIRICDRWESFENFFSDMGKRPIGTWLERINNDGNYEPENCIWATPGQQAKNRNNTVYVEWAGLSHCLKDWSQIFGINYQVLYKRWVRGQTIDQIANYAARR